jgi:hypothetical protein
MELAREDIVIITRHGSAAAVLQGIDPEDLEEVLYETSEQFRRLITARRKTAPTRWVPIEKLAGRGRRSARRC